MSSRLQDVSILLQTLHYPGFTLNCTHHTGMATGQLDCFMPPMAINKSFNVQSHMNAAPHTSVICQKEMLAELRLCSLC